jgi:cell division septation protein DedD
MSRTYYVIELTPRWLGILLVVLAALMVLAFVGGYGAAWSVLGGRPGAPATTAAVGPTPTVATVDVAAKPTVITPSLATPVPAKPTVTPAVAVVTPKPTAAATAPPSPTATPTTSPTPAGERPAALPADEELWVQVLASSRRAAIEQARATLVEAGFPRTNQKVVETIVAGGTTLLKLRVGPFPDRASADRVMSRMRNAGFPDAWVVTP